jgi:hypothetical protein
MRRVLLISGLAMLASLPAFAEPTRDEVMAGAARCDGIADNRVWLDCFYGSAQPMRALLNLAPANPAQVRLVPPPGAEPRHVPVVASAQPRQQQQSGGFWSDVLGDTKPEARDIAMSKYDFDRSGRLRVALANGQVWQQMESDVARAKWKKPASSYRVSVSRGVMGTYDLRVRGEGVVYKVRPAS